MHLHYTDEWAEDDDLELLTYPHDAKLYDFS